MRRFDLSPYVFGVDNLEEIKARLSQALSDGNDVEVVKASGELAGAAIYGVQSSLIEVLFHQDLELSADAVLERQELAAKIKHSPDGSILLEEQEWRYLVAAIKKVSGLRQQDAQFIQRILDAPSIEVQPKE